MKLIAMKLIAMKLIAMKLIIKFKVQSSKFKVQSTIDV